jgi:putative N6-adenine-specific DNA methylase
MAREAIRALPSPIVAADRDAGAIEATRTNAARAGVLDDITVLHQPLSETDLSTLGARGWIVTNPPYGVRTGDPHTLPALWGRLGAIVRGAGTGWTLGAVVPDPILARELRLPLERVLVTSTGGRQVAFMRSRAPRGARAKTPVAGAP